ncbi:MAG: tetratricopeptide repeat protein, partial [Acidobacteriota bacterium]
METHEALDRRVAGRRAALTARVAVTRVSPFGRWMKKPSRLRLALAPLLIAAGSLAQEPAPPADTQETAAEPEQAISRADAYTRFLLARERERVGDVDAAIQEYKDAIRLDPGTAAVRVALANLYNDAHRVAEAMATLHEALRFEPKSIAAHRLLAEILYDLISKGNSETYAHDTRVAFEELVDLSPSDLDARKKLALLALNQGDYAAAKTQLEAVIDDEPDDVDSQLMLAKVYFGLQEYGSAADIYMALEKRQGQVPDREKGGQILTYLFTDRFEEAIKVADEGLKRAGQDSEDYLKLLKLKGLAADRIGDWSLCAKTFRQLLDQNPADREARFKLALALQRKRDLDGALGELEKLRSDLEANPTLDEGDPSMAQVLVATGTALQQKKRPLDAIEVFGKALELTKDQPRMRPEIVERLAHALFDGGRKADAIALIESTRGSDPSLVDLTVEQAELVVKDGRVKDARSLLKGYLENARDKKDKPSLMLVADMYLRVQQPDEALTVLKVAQKLFPDDEDVLFLVGSAYERNGKIDAAEKTFKLLIDRYPKSDRALNYLGYMLADKGVRLDESLAYIQRAMALDANNGAYLDSLGWV